MAKGGNTLKHSKAVERRKGKCKVAYDRASMRNAARKDRKLGKSEAERHCTYCGHPSATLINRSIPGWPVQRICSRCHRRAERGRIFK